MNEKNPRAVVIYNGDYWSEDTQINASVFMKNIGIWPRVAKRRANLKAS